ncbi:DUF6152 family protein [Acuticoccus sediminis]|uniref:DUF6152 family protein n=1 Tax=Acuticoccus sediminis TaxID=2184697 RepID=UPI001CFC8A86|nr:DUF6152 family protein [Acuticoccus sediminis]
MRRLIKTAAVLAVAAAAFAAAGTASRVSAHHGWSSFDTRAAYYVRGTVTYVRWGNPHSEVTIRVDAAELPEGFRERPLPPGGNEANGAPTLASARPYEGEQQELHLVLAGPGWMARWGMDRPLANGETIEVLGFLGSADAEEMRPVMFWLEDGQGVWQQLTALPARPEPAPSN